MGLKWYAAIGASNITEDIEDDELRQKSFKLKNLITHKKYVPNQKYYDVGVLKLDEPIELDWKINTICLPKVILSTRLFCVFPILILKSDKQICTSTH